MTKATIEKLHDAIINSVDVLINEHCRLWEGEVEYRGQKWTIKFKRKKK